ncbi:MAG: hypothetical protein A2934_02215 [Candidatus Sungbacteria bacterium RIFCSPLOWO2_01_FULL_47_10]|uniref:Response regulatory domain-containing protein n=1 Tax=Candidatus Sungbacteria bacterium RIFCSPLOWO2_01_FULL_47_10 TaxID=1802276 RepID=A0A1G2L696_9BACT|nr:MAG: hypothetical protein A2934_02215 [Candidatus Sungbacteria bacterium RIFCSPLOWO2_01_FULL_47_10]
MAPPQDGEQLKKESILVVEDDLFLRNLLVKNLMNEGYDVWVAVDGPSALQTLEEKKPHLIILDLLLPGIDGYEVLSRIKKSTDLSKIPVIVLSNLVSPSDINKTLKLGAADYLTKATYTLEEVAERVKKVLNERYRKVG